MDRRLAAYHGLYLGAMYSIIFAVWLVSLWTTGIPVVFYVLVAVTLLATARMHGVRRSMRVSSIPYTLMVNTFAVMVTALFIFSLLLAVGKETSVGMLRTLLTEASPEIMGMPEMRSAAGDPRIYVAAFSLEYWLVGILVLAPLANMVSLFASRLRRRLQNATHQN